MSQFLKMGELRIPPPELQPSDYPKLEINFKPGDLVIYVPYHAKGNRNHLDCERGVITSIRDETIFVRFGDMCCSQGCRADQLVEE